MTPLRRESPLALLIGLALVAGCSSSPAPESAAPPGSPPSAVGPPPVITGAADSASVLPGAPDALYRYRFRQIEPGSDRFTFQDRDVNFYFRPAPEAIHFQIENRQDRPIEIEWERSEIIDPWGKTDKVAHSSTRWADRFNTQSATTVIGLQRYADYAFPMLYLVDPAGSMEQLHRPLFAEDSSAPQYADRDVVLTLQLRIEGQLRPYLFRFRAASVIPR